MVVHRRRASEYLVLPSQRRLKSKWPILTRAIRKHSSYFEMLHTNHSLKRVIVRKDRKVTSRVTYPSLYVASIYIYIYILNTPN